MAPKKKLKPDEIKAKKKEDAKRRRERIKNDPVLLAAEQEKERRKYEEKKKKGQVKLVKDMTRRELKAARKAWRERTKRSADRKKKATRINQYLAANSPPSSEASSSPNHDALEGSDSPLHGQLDPPTIPEGGRTSELMESSRRSLRRSCVAPAINEAFEDSPSESLASARKNSGRKKVKKDRSKVVRDLKNEMKNSESLRRDRDKWRKRYERLQKQMLTSGSKNSPRKVVNSLMKSGDKKEIAKRLIFGEAMKRHLKQSLDQMSSKREKYKFGQVVARNVSVLKRYKILTRFQTISRKVFSNKPVTNNSQYRRRMKKINESIERDIKIFFEDDEVSKVCPGKRDCITRKKVKMQKRVLTDSMLNLYHRFSKQVDYKIGYTTFTKLKPFWVVSHKVQERDTCVCRVHANMDLMTTAMHKAKIIDRASPAQLDRYVCCSEQNADCLLRKCNECKDKQIPFLQFSTETQISYWKWTQVRETYTDKNNVDKVVTNVVKTKVTVTALEAVDLFDTEFRNYLHHEGIVIHQFRAIKYLKSQLKEDEALIHCDFSENYAMKYASEIQSFHFGGSRKQFTLHTVQVYYKKDSYSEMKTRSLCTLSQSLDHGPASVWCHLQPIFDFLKANAPKLKKLHFLTDSPATQYRNRTIFYLIAHALKTSLDLELATWNYSAPGHGKGAPDGVGGCLKRTADRVVAQGEDIDSFQCFVEVLGDNVRNVQMYVVNESDITAMKEIIPAKIPSFKGTMKVHQAVFRFNSNQLVMRNLSCFYCYDCDHYKLGSLQYLSIAFEENSPLPVNAEVQYGSPPGPSQTGFEQPDDSHASPSRNQVPTGARHATSEGKKRDDVDIPSANRITPGAFVLARFDKTKKTTRGTDSSTIISHFRYVCCVEKVNDDDTLNVTGLRSFQNSRQHFVMTDNDVCAILPSDVLHVLKPPNFWLKNRKMIFNFMNDIDIQEL